MNVSALPPFTHGILSGPEIARQVKHGNIEIEPFDERQVNPASYDLRLGEDVLYHKGNVLSEVRLDTKQAPETLLTKITKSGYVIYPGIGYLMHTEERIHTKCFVPVIDGKSSLGRLFVQVHATAGYGDPGFDGQYTLEVTCTHPVRIYPGMRFAQVRFHTLVGVAMQYEGNYVGEASKGPVASKSWKQFK